MPEILSPDDLLLDERVYSAAERVKQVDGVDAPHRFQYLYVLRNDKLTRFDKDLGPASGFPGAHIAFTFLALFEYSVGEVVDILNLRRYDQPEPEPPSTLWKDWLKEKDEKRQLRAKRSISGPFITIQR